MKVKDFKRCMQMGHGRCAVVLETSDNIGQYKDTVLWGCLHNLAYDIQSEGTRADYVYNLTTYFNDEDYFLAPIISAYEKLSAKKDDLFNHMTDLLGAFAEAGNIVARDSLCEKYSSLLSLMIERKRVNGYDFERDGLERLAMQLCSLGDLDDFVEIVDDLGRLFVAQARYSCEDFDYFCEVSEDALGKKKFLSLLKKYAKKSENVKAFLDSYLDYTDDAAESDSMKEKSPFAEKIDTKTEADAKTTPAPKAKIIHLASGEERLALAESAVAETDPDKKAELLSIFLFRSEGFPLDHDFIIEYSKSENENLRQVSLDLLGDCKSQKVRDYALTLINDDETKVYAIKMLILNYSKEDKDLLLSEIAKFKVDYDENAWHDIGCSIINAADQGVKLPREFFLYIYHTSLCSYCRNSAVRAMAKRRQLSDDIIIESRFDSNEDISNFIKRYY